MGLEYSGYIKHASVEELPWKIDEAKDDVKRARDQMLVLAATIPEDGEDEAGNIIDKEDRLLCRFNECYDYLFESIIALYRLECAKEHLDYPEPSPKEETINDKTQVRSPESDKP